MAEGRIIRTGAQSGRLHVTGAPGVDPTGERSTVRVLGGVAGAVGRAPSDAAAAARPSASRPRGKAPRPTDDSPAASRRGKNTRAAASSRSTESAHQRGRGEWRTWGFPQYGVFPNETVGASEEKSKIRRDVSAPTFGNSRLQPGSGATITRIQSIRSSHETKTGPAGRGVGPKGETRPAQPPNPAPRHCSKRDPETHWLLRVQKPPAQGGGT